MNTYNRGQRVFLELQFLDKDGNPADQTNARVLVIKPGGAQISYGVTHDGDAGSGTYHGVVLADVSGTWKYKGLSDDGGATDDYAFIVKPSAFY